MSDTEYFAAVVHALLQRITELCDEVAQRDVIIAQKEALLNEVDQRTLRIMERMRELRV